MADTVRLRGKAIAMPRLHVVVSAVLCAMALVLASAMPSAAASPAVVSGIVTSQNGVPVPDVSVTALDPGTTSVRSGPAFTGPDGRFTLAAETGVFDFRFEPTSGSGLTPVVQRDVQVLGDLTINVQLVAAPTTPETHRFSGVVTTHEGLAVQNLRVSLGGVMSNANVGVPGGFGVNVPVGSYQNLSATSGLFALMVSGVPGYPYGAMISAGPNAPTFDLTAQDVTQNLRMPPTTTLDVTVLDTAGNPVGGKPVGATGASSPGTSFSFVVDAPPAYRLDSTGSETTTQANGLARLQAFTGVTYPAGSICVRAVPGFVDTFCNTSVVTTDNGPVSVTLTQPTPPSHTFSGTVRTATGASVPHIVVSAGTGSAITLADGRFAITRSPAKYGLTVRGGSRGTGPLKVPGLPEFFTFSGPSDAIDLTTSDLVADLHLPPTVTVTVQVTDATGTPAANIPVDFTGTLSGHALLGLGHQAVQSGETSGLRTDSTGTVRFTVFRGTELAAGNGICARFPVSPSQVCNGPKITASDDTSLTLTQQPPTPTYTLSGTVRDAAGVAVPNANVVYGASVQTNSGGSFSITKDPGTYSLSVNGGGAMGPLGVPGLPGFFRFQHPGIPLTGDMTKEVRLPATTSATVTVKDVQGAGIPGARVSMRGRFSAGFPLLTGEPLTFSGESTADEQTNAQGTFSTTTFRGLTFAPGQICVTLATFNECNTTALDTNAGALTIVFQQQPPVPAIVTGLTAVSPTNIAPALSWRAATNATHYVVYRDGVLLGTTTETAFTDITAADGTHAYTVAAANSAGTGPASAAITVVLDRATPIVTGAPDRQPVSGWYNAPVTITWSSTDPAPSSGTPSVPAATLVQVEGRDQLVSSPKSCDPVANCATGEHRVSIDRTPPAVSTPVWSTNPVVTGAGSTLTAPVTDTLSGVDGGEYFVGTDPGVGNAIPLPYTGGILAAAFGAGLAAGVHDIGVRARDVAGNWSATTTTMLVIVDPAGAGVTGKNKKDLVPSLAAGDVLPGLTQQGQTDSADYGFTVDYRNGALDPRNDFHLTYATGARCSTPNPVNCHRLTVTANSFDWHVIDQDNDSRATFKGVATVTVDGDTTTNVFTVEAIDGDRLSPAADDHLVVTIYATGGNVVLYRASGSLGDKNSVRVR